MSATEGGWRRGLQRVFVGSVNLANIFDM